MRIGENQQLLNLEASDMMHYIGLVEDVGHASRNQNKILGLSNLEHPFKKHPDMQAFPHPFFGPFP